MPHGIGIFTYIWPKFMVNVGKYSLHGASGILKAAVSPVCHRTQFAQLPSDDRSPGVSGVQSFQDVTAAVDVVLVASRDKDGFTSNVRVPMVFSRESWGL